MKKEKFYVQIKDKFKNWFDLYNDELHDNVEPEDFINCTLTIVPDEGTNGF